MRTLSPVVVAALVRPPDVSSAVDSGPTSRWLCLATLVVCLLLVSWLTGTGQLSRHYSI